MLKRVVVLCCALGAVSGCSSEPAAETGNIRDGIGSKASVPRKDFTVTLDGETHVVPYTQMSASFYADQPPEVIWGLRVGDGHVLDLGVRDRTLQLFEKGEATYTDFVRVVVFLHNGTAYQSGTLHLKLREGQGDDVFAIEGHTENMPVDLSFLGPVAFLNCVVSADEVPSVDPEDVQPSSSGRRRVIDSNFESKRCQALLDVGP